MAPRPTTPELLRRVEQAGKNNRGQPRNGILKTTAPLRWCCVAFLARAPSPNNLPPRLPPWRSCNNASANWSCNRVCRRQLRRKVVSPRYGQNAVRERCGRLFSPPPIAKSTRWRWCSINSVGIIASRLRSTLRSSPTSGAISRGSHRLWSGRSGFNLKLNDGDIFRALQPLVAALTNAGVRRISGDLIGDESFFVGPPYGSGWAWDDMNYYYGAEISALTINDNTLRFPSNPGRVSARPCQLTISPATSYVVLSNRTRPSLRVVNVRSISIAPSSRMSSMSPARCRSAT